MPKRTRATLLSLWWKNYYRTIRFCYACGERLKIQYVKEEKKRRHSCQKCKILTYLNPKIIAGLIPVTSSGEILLLRRNIEPAVGLWTYPAGHVELGETIQDGARRETLEEVGCQTKIERFLGVYSYRDAGVVTLVYVGKVPKKEKPIQGVEAQEVKKFKKDEIPWKDLAFRSTTDALKDFLRQSSLFVN